MLLRCLTLLSGFIYLSSANENMCYGSTFVLPREHLRVFNQKVVFVPSNGGATKVVKGNGEVMDPRFRPTLGGGAEMPDLTEQDNGEFFMKFGFTDSLISIITLKIIDCHRAETRDYGSIFSLRIPSAAQYLEFTPAESLNLVTVVWNRTNPTVGRGSVSRYYYWDISHITLEDNGYYKFRGKSNRLLSWKKLVVKEREIDLQPHEGKRLLIEYHQIISIWTIVFKPVGKRHSYTLMKHGTAQWNPEPFEGRIQFINHAIIIEPVQHQDSGTFEFRDEKDNLVQRVDVNMVSKEEETPLPMYLFFIIVPAWLIICCCCIKKCCCKKSSSKRNSPSPETTTAPTDAVVPAAPAVYHRGTTRPTGPSPSRASPVPLNLPVYREPRSTSGGPTVPAPGGPRASPLLSHGSNFISSTYDPKFVLEQSSAPPLNSYTSIGDVYTSGKLSLSEIHTSVGEPSSGITDVYTSDKLNFKY